MSRLLSLAVFAAVAAVVYLLPDPSPTRLAALEIGSLLEEPARLPGGAPMTTVDDDGAEREKPLWEELFDSPAAQPSGDRSITLRLGGTRVIAPGEPPVDPILHGEARRSILRRLRSIVASEGRWDTFDVEGAKKPVPGGAVYAVELHPGTLRLTVTPPGGEPMYAEKDWRAPNRGCLFPPIVAILLAILFRRPVVALLTGVIAGALIEQFRGGAGLVSSVTEGIPRVATYYLTNELTNSERTYIILFVVFMLAMVGVVTRSGGIRGVMDWIARIATSVRHTQIATWLMGLAIFFDDYANTILVGSTMRPLTDRFKISREKLAYIVDSTAAPVAGLSIFSTWIAFEVSTFSAQLPDVGLAASDGYNVFLETLPFRFYCIFTLIFVGLIAFTGRDFGAMASAERRARGGKLLRDGSQPMVGKEATALESADGVRPRAFRALVPVVAFLVMTLLEIARAGGAFSGDVNLMSLEGLATVLYDGSGSRPLMIGSATGLALAALLALLAGLRGDIVRSAWAALRSMGIAIAILYLAWMIGAVCGELGTASYLTVLLGDAVNPLVLPCVLFILSGAVAFSTGSSWSTMSILLPLVVGLAFNLGESVGLGGHVLMIISIGAVLEGAIFGDHCSPISDTTVMSSIASASDHIDHVRTQAPYAIVTSLVALLVGYFPCTFLGVPPLVSLIVGIAVLVGVVFFVGKPVDEPLEQAVAATEP